MRTAIQWLDAGLYSLVLLLVFAAAWLVLRRPHVAWKARERERQIEYAAKRVRAFAAGLRAVARS
jgi:hypothetical protein